ncbi:hypothetical protein ABZ312_37005 [Streptomyces sp. NPDC006207]
MLLQRIAETAGLEAVCTIKIHQPGNITRATRPVPEPTHGSPLTAPAQAEHPVRSRADAPAGYHLALAAIRDAAGAAEQTGFERESRERAAQHDAALRSNREPEEVFADGQAAIEAAPSRAVSRSDDARLCGLEYQRHRKKASLQPSGEPECTAPHDERPGQQRDSVSTAQPAAVDGGQGADAPGRAITLTRLRSDLAQDAPVQWGSFTSVSG